MIGKQVDKETRSPVFPTPQWVEVHGSPRPLRATEVAATSARSAGADQIQPAQPTELGWAQVAAAENRPTVRRLDDPESAAWIAAHGIVLQDEVRRPGGYLLDIRPEGTLVAGFDAAGCFYGEQSLRQLVAAAEIPAITVQDWPYKPIRGIHLYMPGRGDIPFFKRLLRWLASLKYNTIFLEVGGGMRYHSHPEVNAAWEQFCRDAEAFPGGPHALQVGGTRYLKDSTHTELGGGSCLEQAEVADLLTYARGLHFEVVPEAQSLSHAYYLCCAHPEIAELPDDPWPDTYCPSNPASYALYFDLLDEVLAVFQPRILHIGHDEVYNLGVCPACRGKSGNELLAGDLLRIHTFLKARGVRMAMWGDTLLPFTLNNWEGGVARHVARSNGACADIPETYRAIETLPRDVLISEWQGNTTPRAMQFFLKEGFDVVCGNFGDNFAAHSFPHWDARSASAQVVGGEPSTWCAVSEFAFGYNGCLFNMAFSAELLWWQHYRDAERGRLAAQVAGLMPLARRMLGGETEAEAKVEAEVEVALPAAHVSPLPFAPELRGIRVSRETPAVLIPVGQPARSLTFTHACQTLQTRRPTWELADPYRQLDENRLAAYTVHYQDGSRLEVPVYFGTQVSRWDVPYGEHIDAIPYEADPIPLGTACTDRRITAYRWRWANPQPEKAIRSLELAYRGHPAGTLWLLAAVAQ